MQVLNRMRHFMAIFAVVAALFCACDNDDEKGDGGDAPTTLTKTEVHQALCDQLKVCDTTLYEQAGGDAGCLQVVALAILTEADCPAANYNPAFAANCVNKVSALTCEQFSAALFGLMSGSGESSFPPVCNNMCSTVAK